MLASGAIISGASAPALGTCTVYTLSEPADYLVLEPQPATYLQPLDAGPALRVTGPRGQKYVPRGLDGYEATLGRGTSEFPEYLVPGPYRVDNGSGGAGLGPFQATLDLLPPLIWTNEAEISNVPRSSDLTVTWDGGDPDREFVLIAGASLNTASKAQASFVCSERVRAGRFVVPAAVLSNLPVSSEWTGAGVPSALGIGTQPVVANATFTAPGLDLGVFRYLNARIKVVHYRD
jgi:hypothetical protein